LTTTFSNLKRPASKTDFFQVFRYIYVLRVDVIHLGFIPITDGWFVLQCFNFFYTKIQTFLHIKTCHFENVPLFSGSNKNVSILTSLELFFWLENICLTSTLRRLTKNEKYSSPFKNCRWHRLDFWDIFVVQWTDKATWKMSFLCGNSCSFFFFPLLLMILFQLCCCKCWILKRSNVSQTFQQKST